MQEQAIRDVLMKAMRDPPHIVCITFAGNMEKWEINRLWGMAIRPFASIGVSDECLLELKSSFERGHWKNHCPKVIAFQLLERFDHLWFMDSLMHRIEKIELVQLSKEKQCPR